MASFLQIQITGMTVNGTRLPDVDYARTEHADGTVTETGTPPPGVTAATKVDDVIGAALSPALVAQPDHPNAARVGDPTMPRPKRPRKEKR